MRQAGYECWTVIQGQEIRHHPDVLVQQRGAIRQPALAGPLAAWLHENGTVLVGDFDDDSRLVWDGSEQEHLDELRAGLATADLLTCTTEHLAARLRQENPNVVALPNLIAPELWTGTWRRSGPVTIGLVGGDTHVHNWELASWLFPELARKYGSGVKFLVCGNRLIEDAPWYQALADKLGPQLEHPAWLPSDRYQEVVNRVDIGLAPLLDTEFNRCRSPVKWLEYSLAWAASVVSPTVYADYVQPGRDALVAENADDWLRCCQELIDSRTRRQTLAARARLRIVRDYNVHDPKHLRTRMLAYRDCWERVMGRRYARTSHPS